MLRASVEPFLETLRKHDLLDGKNLQELVRLARGAACSSQQLAEQAVRRGWLTTYQAHQLVQGRGANLHLGPYVLLERLGQGGMAVVFKARHRLTDRIVALKVIRPELVTNQRAVARFRREIQVAALLNHPNIVRAVDADEVGGIHYFAMEYVDGTNLTKLVKSRGALEVWTACDYIRQAALGLEHAHEKGLVHRDIKPSNLILARGVPKAEAIKILDLGLARLHVPFDFGDNTDLTSAGTMMGTPDFLPPEQAADPHAADIRADLYSLGCSFYYLLAAKVPFAGTTAVEKLFKHRLEPAPPLSDVRPDVPAPVVQIVQRLMAKRPDDRYQTPAALVAALDALPAVLASGGAVNQPAGMGARSVAALHRCSIRLRASWRRALLIAALGLMLPTLALGVLAVWSLSSGPAVSSAETEPPQAAEDAVRQALNQLVARAVSPRTDGWQLRQDVVAFRTRHAASAAGKRAAELLQDLPSPFDALSGQGLAKEPRVSGLGDVVLDLGDTRLRHGGIAWSAALSPDGKSLVSGGDDRQVYQWDTANGQRQRVFTGPGAPITALAWSPDGKWVVSGSHDWTARLLDMTAGKEKAILRHQGNVRAVAVSADSRLLATAAHPDPGKATGPIRIWDLEGKELFRLDGHHGPVVALAFAPRGPWLASGGDDKTIRLWDLQQRKEIATLRGHDGPVFALDFSADGHTLASGGADKTVRLWDVGHKKERIGARDLGHTVTAVSFVPRSNLLAVGAHDGSLRLLDAGNGDEKGVLRQRDGLVALSIALDGQLAATTAFNGAVRLWDLPKQKEIQFQRRLAPIQSLAVAPDDRTFATGHAGGRIRLWDAASGKEIAALDKHQHGVPAVAFSPDGGTLLSGGWDNSAIVWDVQQRKDRLHLRGHQAGVIGVAFSPDGALAGTASHDKTVRLWNAQSGKEQATLAGHSHHLHALAFSPDGKTLASGGSDRTLKLWDVGKGTERGALAEYTGDSFAFLPDGKTLVSGSSHSAVNLWNALVPASTAGAVPGLKMGWIRTLAVSADGATLALAGHDGQLVLWDLVRNKELRQGRVPGMATSLTFSGDSRHLLCVLNNGAACVVRIGKLGGNP